MSEEKNERRVRISTVLKGLAGISAAAALALGITHQCSYEAGYEAHRSEAQSKGLLLDKDSCFRRDGNYAQMHVGNGIYSLGGFKSRNQDYCPSFTILPEFTNDNLSLRIYHGDGNSHNNMETLVILGRGVYTR